MTRVMMLVVTMMVLVVVDQNAGGTVRNTSATVMTVCTWAAQPAFVQWLIIPTLHCSAWQHCTVIQFQRTVQCNETCNSRRRVLLLLRLMIALSSSVERRQIDHSFQLHCSKLHSTVHCVVQFDALLCNVFDMSSATLFDELCVLHCAMCSQCNADRCCALIDDCFQLWRPAVICPVIDHTLLHQRLTSTPNT